MFKLDHDLAKRAYTLCALVVVTTGAFVRIAMYEDEVADLKSDRERDRLRYERDLSDIEARLAYLESQSRSRGEKDQLHWQAIQRLQSFHMTPQAMTF